MESSWVDTVVLVCNCGGGGDVVSDFVPRATRSEQLDAPATQPSSDEFAPAKLVTDLRDRANWWARHGERSPYAYTVGDADIDTRAAYEIEELARRLTNALATIKALIDKSAWRPIEAAPKDIVWCMNGHEYGPYILASVRGGDVDRVRWWQFEKDRGACNFLTAGGSPVHPTHWMPLPGAPK